MLKTTANVETKFGDYYAKRLCRHFAHKIPTAIEGRKASIEFPFGRCDIDVDDTNMRIVVELSDPEQIIVDTHTR